MMLEKIISGGQTGADQAGLEAAKELGIATGGTAPQHFMSERGTCLKLRDEYGLTEGLYDSKVYPKRTRQNVEDSDATAIFGNVGSPGTRLTCSLCVELEKPWVVNPTAVDLLEFLEQHNVKVLNVAGNRESVNPGIQARVRNFLVEVCRGCC